LTPVIFLSDGYIANGSEALEISAGQKDLKDIKMNSEGPRHQENETIICIARDERLVRKWAIPVLPVLEHRVGGFEKEDVTWKMVSYDSR